MHQRGFELSKTNKKLKIYIKDYKKKINLKNSTWRNCWGLNFSAVGVRKKLKYTRLRA